MKKKNFIFLGTIGEACTGNLATVECGPTVRLTIRENAKPAKRTDTEGLTRKGQYRVGTPPQLKWRQTKAG